MSSESALFCASLHAFTLRYLCMCVSCKFCQLIKSPPPPAYDSKYWLNHSSRQFHHKARGSLLCIHMYISTNTNKMLADRRHRLCFQCSGVNKHTYTHTYHCKQQQQQQQWRRWQAADRPRLIDICLCIFCFVNCKSGHTRWGGVTISVNFKTITTMASLKASISYQSIDICEKRGLKQGRCGKVLMLQGHQSYRYIRA